jgi:hypothetical protein
MKKILCLLLCIVLLVSCGIADEPNMEAESEDSAAPPSEFAARLETLEPYEQRSEIISRFHEQTTYELIPRDDYGRLYPFNLADFRFNYELYGFMTAGGEVVIDAVFNQVSFIHDIDDGYYVVQRITGEDLQREYAIIAADGSRALTVSGYPVLLGGGLVRVFEWESVGVVDMDGNITEPFINTEENYILFMAGAGTSQSYTFYANKNTGEAFTNIQWLPWTGVIELTGSEDPRMNATEEIRELYRETPGITYGLFPPDSGFVTVIEDYYSGVKNADGEWVIKIDLLKYRD